MKVLFVSTSIPPATDMQTTRNMYLIKSLLDHSISVDIITCGNYNKGQSSFDDILGKTNIFRTAFPSVFKWHQFVQAKLSKTPYAKFHNVVVRKYAKPDLYMSWEKLAIECIDTNDLSGYDVIITSSGSYTAHYVGRYWKQKYNKIWVADYGDPWGLDGNGNKVEKYYNNELELLSNCDGLIFTTQSTIDAYERNYNLSTPYFLVECGYDDVLLDKQSEYSNNKLNFTYTGVAYKSSRNLEPFLKAISKEPKSYTKIVGTYSNALKKEMAGFCNISFSGRVTYADSLDILAFSDVLVYIGNYGIMQVPGKTYIYLSTEKPILYIQQQKENDPTLAVLQKFNGVVVTQNDEDSIYKAIEYVIDNYDMLKEQAAGRIENKELQRYKWDNLGNKFVGFIEKRVNEINQQ